MGEVLLHLFVEIGHSNTSGKDSVVGMFVVRRLGNSRASQMPGLYSNADPQSKMGNIASKANCT